ncbi:DEKNAAC100069 [Brettanomyces naardenensis]|uniref:DEKNAAC100069 n=1 Tax=Brettanomyces naardenensis TaxID=13370 RepID=A0A448YED9_BRENA|nr:DEKNAAC100069 [Brettanomyces naardenensis]
MNSDQISKISRGSIPALFLGSDLNAADWAGKMKVEMNNFEDVGGFSLLFGQLRANHGVNTGDIEPLYIFSNRYEETVSVFNTQGHKPSDSSSPHDYKCSKLQYCDNIGLSNSPYLEPWPKVDEGKKLLKRVTKKSIEEKWGKEELIENLFSVLSVAHPSGSSEWMSYDFETGFKQMPQSIFIPPLRKKSNVGLELERITSNPSLSRKYYGTRTQTIILVDRQGKVTYTERNLHTGEDLEEIPQTRTHVFDIEGWDNDIDESEKAERDEVKTRLSEEVRGNIEGEADGEDLR